MKRKTARTTPETDDGRDKLTPLERDILKEANREVTVRGSNGAERIGVREALVRKHNETAMKGSPQALNQSTKLIIEAERKRRLEIEREVAIGKFAKKTQTELVEATLRDGGDPNAIVPHPDDITIDDDRGYFLTGPVNEEELEKVGAECLLRDTFLLQHVLEDRLNWPEQPDGSSNDSELQKRGSALLFACFLNCHLPTRFQMSEMQMCMFERQYRRKTKRELLKLARRAWAQIGANHPRGWRTPPFKQAEAWLERTANIFSKLLPDIKTGKLRDQKSIEEALANYL